MRVSYDYIKKERRKKGTNEYKKSGGKTKKGETVYKKDKMYKRILCKLERIKCKEEI